MELLFEIKSHCHQILSDVTAHEYLQNDLIDFLPMTQKSRNSYNWGIYVGKDGGSMKYPNYGCFQTSTQFKENLSDHSKDIHKQKLLTRFGDDQT